MSGPFKYYFSNELPFWEKRGSLIPGRRSLNISRQKGVLYSMVTKNVHQTSHICWSCNKNVSVFRCNPSIQKHQKQLAKSKEICVSVVRFVLWLIHVPDGYISWRIFQKVHERDEDFVTYQVTHPGNNKQSVPLNLAIFQETKTATIKRYFPNRLDGVNFLTLFYKVFVICNFWNVSIHQTNLAM